MNNNYNYSQYEPTYNKALDLVGNLVGCARHNREALKAIHLKPIYYEWVRSGVQTLMNKDLEEDQPLQFDGVNIEKGSKFQTKIALLEYYETERLG